MIKNSVHIYSTVIFFEVNPIKYILLSPHNYTVNNNNHMYNDNNKGMATTLLKAKEWFYVPDDATTKSIGMDVETKATKSTTNTGVGSNDTGVMEQRKRIKWRIWGLSMCSRRSDDNNTFLFPTLRLGWQNGGGGIISSQSHC